MMNRPASRREVTKAAEWFTANRAGLAPRQREEFVAWLEASPRHVQEYLEVARLDGVLRRSAPVFARLASDRPAAGIVPQRIQRKPLLLGPRTWAYAAAAAVGAIAIGWLWIAAMPRLSAPLAQIQTERLATNHGEQVDQRLQDDSIVHLNTDSAVTIRYERSQRLVLLTRGQADFEVAHDPARPFKVIAGAAAVVAHGTNFDVRLKEGATVVTVVNGNVSVLPALALEPRGAAGQEWLPVELGPGQQVSVSGDQWPPSPAPVDVRQATAWLHRQITFDREPLSVVVAEFNRYSSKPIEIKSPSLGQLRISGVFSTDNTEDFIAFLRTLKGVRVDITETRISVSER